MGKGTGILYTLIGLLMTIQRGLGEYNFSSYLSQGVQKLWLVTAHTFDNPSHTVAQEYHVTNNFHCVMYNYKNNVYR